MLPSKSRYYVYTTNNVKTIVFETPVEIDVTNFKKIKDLEVVMKDNVKMSQNDYLYYHPEESMIPNKSKNTCKHSISSFKDQTHTHVTFRKHFLKTIHQNTKV